MDTITTRFALVALLILAIFSHSPAAEQERPDDATLKIFQEARALLEKDKFEEAEALVSDAIAGGNDHVVLHMALAENYAEQKDFEKASESFHVVWCRTQAVPMLEGYTVALIQLKDFDRLREVMRDILDNFDKMKEGRLAAFMLAAADGDRDLFVQAIVRISAEEIRENKMLASIIAQTAKKLAHDEAAKGDRKQAEPPR